jgi:hypothetical protein
LFSATLIDTSVKPEFSTALLYKYSKKFTNRKHQQSAEIVAFFSSTNLNTELSDFDEVVEQLNNISEEEAGQSSGGELEEESSDGGGEEVNVNGEEGSDGEHEDEGSEEEGSGNNDTTMYVPAAGSANVYISMS